MAGYTWFDAKEQLEVQCPRCRGCATVDAPFDFLPANARAGEPRPEDHRWASWTVIERYPSVVRWQAPTGALYDMRSDAVLKCGSCHLVAARPVTWPADACYQWEIRDHTLWAYNREHAHALLRFLKGRDRDPSSDTRFERSLQHIPREFLTAKVREDVVRAISESLHR